MKRRKTFILFLVVVVSILTTAVYSPAPAVTNADYTSQPPFISSAVPPMVMMIMGRDHKLYKPAYNDASDIDGDGLLDTTYKHSIDYYGYFDPFKCYDYGNLTSGVDGFFPTSITATKYCNGTKWSGNFLNWLGTSRLDALRRVLYGGFRTVDNTNLTVLEAEHINEDAHSWGKEYAGPDIAQLAPFTDVSGGILPECVSDWKTPQAITPNPLPGGLDCTNQPWLYYNQAQKIMEVTYDDAGYTDGRQYGDTHTDMIKSFSLCDWKSVLYIDDFNNSDLTKTGSCATKTIGSTTYILSCPITQDHMDTMNRILVVEFQVTSATAGAWDFAIDGVNGVEMQLGHYAHSTDTWTTITSGADDTVVAYYGQHGDSARWTTAPYGPNTTSPDFGAGATNYCTGTSPANCAKQVHTGVPLNTAQWYRMIVRMRTDATGNKYDGVKIFYRNPETRLATHSGNHWVVFGAVADIDGANITTTNITSGNIAVDFYRSSASCPTCPNTIVRGSGSFLTDGFQVGDTITTTYSNDSGPFTIKSISADGKTITTNEDMSNTRTGHSYTINGTRGSIVPVNLVLRAPQIPSGESIRFKDRAFIKNGEPSWQNNPATDPADVDSFGHIITCEKHLLFCVTSTQAETNNSPTPPIIRVLPNSANRIWEWASTERAVCSGPETAGGYQHLIGSSGGGSSINSGDYKAYYDRVKVCDPAVGLESWCKLYPGGGGTYKPAGLFQKYGEGADTVCSKSFIACNTDSDCAAPQKCIQRGQMFFGLMTGSYTKNMSGGVIRSNIDAMSHQVDNKNVGQLKSPGGAAGSDGFPITNLDRLRMTGFDYGSFSYSCGWIEDRPMNEGECRMWGNPIGEMMYEGLRYFAGKGAPTAAYASGTGASGTDDEALGLTNQSSPTNNWIKPYDKFPLCSKPFMIVLSDVNPSYDSDQLPGVDDNFKTSPAFTGDLTGLTSVKDLADQIGKTEGINGTNVFIGQTGATTDTLCTSKTAGTSGIDTAGLGSIRGLCAEEPTKKGSYYSAAVAYYGKNQFGQYNKDSNGNSLPNVTTYSVALISPVPEIKLTVGGKEVKIVPAGKSVSGCLNVDAACMNKCTLAYNISGDNTSGLSIKNCSSTANCPTDQIVGFYVDSYNDTYGKFRVSFEDTEQGADHDMDAIVEYTYQVNDNGTLTISLNSTYAAGCIDQVMGFVISGTTQDGTYLAVRDLDATNDASHTVVRGLPTSWQHTFTPSAFGSSTRFLQNPLWYAAKWGGFEDQNNNSIPDLQDEWDRDHKGDPETYFLISNPLKMEQQLTQVFEDILKKSASGTSVSILATSAEGEGALYQAYFYPEKPNPGDNSRKFWLGYVRGLFLDSFGNLREDSNDDNKLIFNDDQVIRMKLDPSTNQVTADLYLATSETGTPAVNSPTPTSTVGVDSIKALWEAGEMLAKRDKSTRNMYVWVDNNNDGVVQNGDFSSFTGEAVEFRDTNSALLMPYLGTASTGTAASIINFVRGNEVTGLRDRCLPISGGVAAENGCTAGPNDRVWALSDVVYSTPTTIAGPKEQYDQIYGDTSYLAFRQAYLNRRNVVYLGGNDGMLHAFNAGVYHAGDDSGTGSIEHGWFEPNPSSGNGWTSPAPAMGDELWAFIPYDNLPHLQWLASPAYSHVYYVDLRPKATDVRIFNDPATSFSGGIDGQPNTSHPKGWGTILIVGQRLGGGAMNVTADFGSGSQTRTFRSAYYVLDVTDPEKPPRLLWRFTDSALGFSTTFPGIGHIKSGSTEKWFMIAGSGPDNNAPSGTRGYDGTSTQTGKVYIVNLLNGTIAKTFTVDANSFMGDPTVVDGDLDFTTDTIYIGNVISTTAGKVYRINTNSDLNAANWTLSTLINQTKPLLVGPSVALDSFNNHWVLFGTGRFWSNGDKSNTDQQTLYGIKDACWKENSGARPCATTYTTANLKNTSLLSVCTGSAGGKIYDSSTGTCSSGSVAYSSFNALLNDIRANYSGWYMNLTHDLNPSERMLSKSVLIGGIALMTTFTPNSDPCAVQGNSSLYALYYETGTAYIKAVVGVSGSGTSETVNKKTDLGKGLPTTVGVAVGKTTKGFIQTSTGAIVQVNVAPAFGVRSGADSWKEKAGGGTFELQEIYKHIVK